VFFSRRCGRRRSPPPRGARDAFGHGPVFGGLVLAAAWLSLFTLSVVSDSHAADTLPSYFTRVLDTEDGLPQNSVTAILQTRDGYLWIGTYNGLARFDGNTFTVFTGEKNSSPGLRNSRIVSLFEDNDGTLWIAHETGELSRYKEGRFEAVDYRVPWENRRILSMGSDQTGKLWLLNEQGRLAAISGENLSLPNPDTGTRLTSMARNSRGQIWIACAGQLFALTNSQLVAIEPGRGNEGPGGYVTGIAAALDDTLWVISGDRIRKWDGHQLIADLGPTPWDQSSISAAVETHGGALAVGTLGNGVFLFFPGKGVIHFDRSNGFPHDWTRCLFEDREGTLWAGTGSGGMVALRAGKVRVVSPPDQWRERDVLSVTTTADGAIWVGTEGGGIYQFLNGSWAHFNEYHGLSNTFVWAVAPDSQGRLWAGTWGGGVFVRERGQFVIAPGLESMNAPAPALLHGSNGITWLGTGQGVIRYDNGTITTIGRREGLNFPDVRAVVEDGVGGVWFGMMGGGLGHWRDGKLRQFDQSDGLTSDYVQSLRIDSDGVLWIGTYGGGVNRFKHDRISAITVAEGLPNNVICHIEEDGEQNLWFSSRGGIFRVAKAELNRCADGETNRVRCLSYGKADGMPTLECTGGSQPAGCRTPDGHLWFPTTKGLVVINPREAKVNQLPPPVVIESLQIEGREVSFSGVHNQPLEIPPGNQRFEFRYTALTFVATEKVRFRYRMAGLGEEWKDAGNQRIANYSYLPPGNYTFQVMACNGDGVWNTLGATLAFTIHPHFWQRWWFVLLEILAAATLLVLIVLTLARRRMKMKLERLERQRAIERERARIAQDIHDNLGASLTRISLLSQSAHSELHDAEHAAIQLDRIYSTSRELTRAMDEIVWAVNPQHDTLDSLANYLGKFAQDFLGPLQIRCRLDVPVDLPHWPVTAEVRHNLFLAVKEALHNVVKHAAASEVSVTLTIAANTFTYAIRDNGRGFSPDAPASNAEGRIAGGNGLVNMRARLEKLGGACDIESAPGNGTAVKLTVPVTVPAH
jgi:ligand-binding sensor domain-containing protein/two-component sensor histidine kinase